jgi:hypothetical protein
MGNDAARRREQQRLERLRLAERGEGAVERGEGAVERGEGAVERGEGAVERGEGAVERGEGAVERGMILDDFGSKHVAADIFRRAAGLGGHLVVAFIAPVGASSPRSRLRPLRSSPSEAEAVAARVVVARMIEQATGKLTERPSAPQPAVSTSETAAMQAGSAPTTASWAPPKD